MPSEERKYEKPRVHTVKEGYWRDDNTTAPIKPAWCITWHGLHIRFYGDGAVEVYDDMDDGYRRVHERQPREKVK